MSNKVKFSLETVNRRFCKIKFNDKDLLCIPYSGYFASKAFLNGGDMFRDVSGQSFGIITGDDNMLYKESKHKVSEVTDDEIQELLKDDRLDASFITNAKELLDEDPIRPFDH